MQVQARRVKVWQGIGKEGHGMERCKACNGTINDPPALACSNRLYHRAPTMMRHWVTRYDPDDGEPFGELCACEIGHDHNGLGNMIG